MKITPQAADASTQWTDWIAHDGVHCPIVYAKAGEYEAQLRNGDIAPTYLDAIDLDWSDDNSDRDIVRYRLRKPSPDYRALLEMAVEALEKSFKTMRNACSAIETNQVVDKDVHGVLMRSRAATLSTITTIKTALDATNGK